MFVLSEPQLSLICEAQEWQKLRAKGSVCWASPCYWAKALGMHFPKEITDAVENSVLRVILQAFNGFWVNSETQMPFYFPVMNLH